MPFVVSVKPMDRKRIFLTFSNGEKRFFDVLPYIKGDWFGQLADDSFFRKVKVEGKTVTWDDGQDIAPHELYELSVPAV